MHSEVLSEPTHGHARSSQCRNRIDINVGATRDQDVTTHTQTLLQQLRDALLRHDADLHHLTACQVEISSIHDLLVFSGIYERTFSPTTPPCHLLTPSDSRRITLQATAQVPGKPVF